MGRFWIGSEGDGEGGFQSQVLAIFASISWQLSYSTKQLEALMYSYITLGMQDERPMGLGSRRIQAQSRFEVTCKQ